MKMEALTAPALAWAFAAIVPADVGVFLASIAGAYASNAWAEKVEPRSKLFSLMLAQIIIGLAFTVITNAVIGFVFEGFAMTSGVRMGVAAIVSCLMRWFFPWLIQTVSSGGWLAWIPFLNKKGA